MPEGGEEPIRLKALVPGCRETDPETGKYRGKAADSGVLPPGSTHKQKVLAPVFAKW